MSSGIVSSAMPIEYRNVPGFDGYRVDIHGGVWTIWGKGRSAKRKNPSRDWRLLKPGVASNGYLTVSLSRGNGCETRTVHSLVLEAFVGPPPAGQLCRHKDGSYTNCRLGESTWENKARNRFASVSRRSQSLSQSINLTSQKSAAIKGVAVDNCAKFALLFQHRGETQLERTGPGVALILCQRQVAIKKSNA